MWEVRTGPQPTVSTKHVTEGVQSLKAVPGNLLATHRVTRDWSGFKSLELDIYNACNRAVKMELLIGDDAWIGSQNYWNRHNRTITLAPGENHISVPVDDLYRGEGAARNRGDIKRNLDADQINFISFTFAGKAAFGDLFLDNFHFIKGGAAVATVESGTPSSTSPVTPIPSTAVAPVRPAAKAPVAPPGTYVWADSCAGGKPYIGAG